MHLRRTGNTARLGLSCARAPTPWWADERGGTIFHSMCSSAHLPARRAGSAPAVMQTLATALGGLPGRSSSIP
jgi:hypothetical protein